MKRQLTAIIVGTMLTITSVTLPLPASATITSTNSQDLAAHLKDAKKHRQSVVKQESISLAEKIVKHDITTEIADQLKDEFNRSSQKIFLFTPFSSLAIVILMHVFARQRL